MDTTEPWYCTVCSRAGDRAELTRHGVTQEYFAFLKAEHLGGRRHLDNVRKLQHLENRGKAGGRERKSTGVWARVGLFLKSSWTGQGLPPSYQFKWRQVKKLAAARKTKEALLVFESIWSFADASLWNAVLVLLRHERHFKRVGTHPTRCCTVIAHAHTITHTCAAHSSAPRSWRRTFCKWRPAGWIQHLRRTIR